MTIKEKIKSEIGLILIVLGLGIISGCQLMTILQSTAIYANAKDIGYKAGQIDYANGRIAFELKKQYDGSTQWEKKEVTEKK